MKEHKWLITFMEIVPDELHTFSFIIRGGLRNSDGRRKEHWFAFSVERDATTLEQVADAFKEGDKTMKIIAMPKPRKNKGPIVDPRQIEMFKGGFDESDKTVVDEVVWQSTTLHREGS
jgi:hypothetical protein